MLWVLIRSTSHLTETLLMNTHKICFFWRNKNNIMGISYPNPFLIWSYDIHLPANIPDIPVASSGVLNLSLTLARNLNNKPSLDIAYITRGRGNIAPSKLKGTSVIKSSAKEKFYSSITFWNLFKYPVMKTIETSSNGNKIVNKQTTPSHPPPLKKKRKGLPYIQMDNLKTVYPSINTVCRGYIEHLFKPQSMKKGPVQKKTT